MSRSTTVNEGTIPAKGIHFYSELMIILNENKANNSNSKQTQAFEKFQTCPLRVDYEIHALLWGVIPPVEGVIPM